nr:hypothetical protein [Pseudomonas sp. A46]
MSDLIQNHGGNLVRVFHALDGFKKKYGYWPIEIHLSRETIETLHYHLTQEGYRHLDGFVKISEIDDERIIAKGLHSDTFDYGHEGWEIGTLNISAAELLGMA